MTFRMRYPEEYFVLRIALAPGLRTVSIRIFVSVTIPDVGTLHRTVMQIIQKIIITEV